MKVAKGDAIKPSLKQRRGIHILRTRSPIESGSELFISENSALLAQNCLFRKKTKF